MLTRDLGQPDESYASTRTLRDKRGAAITTYAGDGTAESAHDGSTHIYTEADTSRWEPSGALLLAFVQYPAPPGTVVHGLSRCTSTGCETAGPTW